MEDKFVGKKTVDPWSVAARFLFRVPLFFAAGFAVSVGLAMLGVPEWLARVPTLAIGMLSMKVWMDAAGRSSRQFYIVWIVLTNYLIVSAYLFEYVW